jgi:hypothetical protein
VLLIPLILAMLFFMFSDSIVLGAVFFGLLGVSAGFDLLLNAIIWRDLLGLSKIASMRSLVEGVRIVLVGLAPIVIGWLLDGGVSMTTVCGAMATYAVLATALATYISLGLVSQPDLA